MKWITRERPKIDRIACPWLIKNFIDPQAEFFFVPKEQVFLKAQQLRAIPFDIPGAEYSHYGDKCSFEYFIEKHQLTDPVLHSLAPIARGADTNRFDLAPQAAGLWAISAGLSVVHTDDQDQLVIGMKIYDALYAMTPCTLGQSSP
jgi:hypothetical protein